jgi:hypothetical protein
LAQLGPKPQGEAWHINMARFRLVPKRRFRPAQRLDHSARLHFGVCRDARHGYGRAVVGGDDQVAVCQELGTSRIPPWSFLGGIARRYIRSIRHSAGHNNDNLQLLHAVKLLLEIAHEVVKIEKRHVK